MKRNNALLLLAYCVLALTMGQSPIIQGTFRTTDLIVDNTATADGGQRIFDNAGTGLVSLANAVSLDYATKSQIVAWGDSLTRGAGSTSGTGYPTFFSELTGWANFNEGGDGNTSTQIATRFFADTAKHSRPTVIWSGRNNYQFGSVVQADIASMVAALGTSSYIVLSILNSDASSEYIGQPNYNLIIALNNALGVTYGPHYLDVRAYLVSLYNPSIPQDVIDHANDVPPSSLRSDAVHLNDAGYTAVANYIIAHLVLLQADPVKAIVETNVANPTTTMGSLALTGQLNAIGGTVTVPGITLGVTTNVSGFPATGLYNSGAGVVITNDGFDIIATSINGSVLNGNVTFPSGGRVITIDAAQPTYFQFGANKDDYIRAGETPGVVHIADTNTGGVNLGAVGNPTSVLGTLSVVKRVIDSGATAAISSCGTSSIVGGAWSGIVSVVGTTTCTITFGSSITMNHPAICEISTNGTAKGYAFSTTPTTLAFTSLTAGQDYHFVCEDYN